jgi:hypothetical protein
MKEHLVTIGPSQVFTEVRSYICTKQVIASLNLEAAQQMANRRTHLPPYKAARQASLNLTSHFAPYTDAYRVRQDVREVSDRSCDYNDLHKTDNFHGGDSVDARAGCSLHGR